MGTAIPRHEVQNNERQSETNKSFHLDGHTETAPPKRGRTTKLPRELKWFACQAVKVSLDGSYIELRSFPFWALSLAHARSEILAATQKDGCPYTDIYQFAVLNEKAGQKAKCKIEANKINILTGKKS